MTIGFFIEAFVVLALFGLLVLTGWLEPEALLHLGAGLAAVALCASMAVGVVYHVRLRQALMDNRRLPRRWWWAPTRLHGRLDPQGKAAVMPYFRAGWLLVACSFGGLLFVAVGAVKALLLTR